MLPSLGPYLDLPPALTKPASRPFLRTSSQWHPSPRANATQLDQRHEMIPAKPMLKENAYEFLKFRVDHHVRSYLTLSNENLHTHTHTRSDKPSRLLMLFMGCNGNMHIYIYIFLYIITGYFFHIFQLCGWLKLPA